MSLEQGKICGLCRKFQPSEAPQSLKDFEKRLLWNEDGTERRGSPELETLQVLVSMASIAGVSYGHRICTFEGAGSGAQLCQVPEEFTPKS